MISWLYLSTIEISLLIVLVLFLRPLSRRLFGSQITYCLWLIPLLGVPLKRLQASIPLESLELIISSSANIQAQLSSPIESAAFYNNQLLLNIWLVGICTWSAIRISKALRFQNLLSNNSEHLDSASMPFKEILTQLQLKPGIVRITPLPGTPFIAGLVAPKLFLPKNFFEQYSAQEQRWILSHELIHLKRRDLIAKFLAECFRALFWFNPLLHIAAYLIRHDQELACDQEVLSMCSKEERYQYGKILMQESALQLQGALISFFGSRFFGNHKERYTMLAKHRKSSLSTFLGLICFLIIASVSLTVAPVSDAQQSAASVSRADPIEPILIEVSPLGEIRIGGDVIPNRDLRRRIEQKIAETPDAEVLIEFEGADLDDLASTANPANVSMMAIMDILRVAEVEHLQLRTPNN